MMLSEYEPALDLRSTSSSHIRVPSDTPDNETTYIDYEWTNFCPEFFSALWHHGDLDTDDYMLSVCCVETLKHVTSPGRNGYLYLPHDSRFIIKTMRKSEMKVFLEMLPKYYQHVQKYKNTLLTKFYGLHLVKPSEGKKVRFVVMGNPLQSDLTIHKRYDLKGLSQGRGCCKAGSDKNNILKDHDLDLVFQLDSSLRNRLLAQIKLDCEFLEQGGIMDYSLLLGLHICRPVIHGFHAKESIKSCCSGSSPQRNSDENSICTREPEQYCHLELNDALGVRMAARAVHVQRNDGVIVQTRWNEEAFDVVLYTGLMNILQEYNVAKKVEHAFKSLHLDAQSISAVNPKIYSGRFQEFLPKLFPEKKMKSGFVEMHRRDDEPLVDNPDMNKQIK